MAIQTKQQKRAAFALGEINGLMNNGNIEEKTVNFIVGTPNMILSNGLGQTLAFLLAKKSDKAREFVFSVLKKYLCMEYKTDFAGADDNFKFLKKFNDISQLQYLTMQQECLRMLEWLKRYARAFQK